MKNKNRLRFFKIVFFCLFLKVYPTRNGKRLKALEMVFLLFGQVLTGYSSLCTSFQCFFFFKRLLCLILFMIIYNIYRVPKAKLPCLACSEISGFYPCLPHSSPSFPQVIIAFIFKNLNVYLSFIFSFLKYKQMLTFFIASLCKWQHAVCIFLYLTFFTQ